MEGNANASHLRNAVRFDLLTLKLFIAVVEEQSIARAAEREHIVASAVSKRISDLEQDLKVQLLQRHNRGITPTPAGDAVLRHARSVMRDLVQLEGELAEHAQGLKGEVRLFATSTALLRFLPRQLVSFLAQHPLVQIEIEESISPAIVKAISENRGEIGIFGGSVPTLGLHVLPYRDDLISVIVPKGHPLAAKKSVRFAEALDHDLVGLQAGSSIDLLATRAADELGRSMKLRIRLTGFDALCRVVEAKLGIGLVPHSIAAHYLDTLAIEEVALDEPWAWRALKLAVRDSSSLSIASRLLLNHLADPAT
jgi:DNA-binding transcriptional LysR family regulator